MTWKKRMTSVKRGKTEELSCTCYSTIRLEQRKLLSFSLALYSKCSLKIRICMRIRDSVNTNAFSKPAVQCFDYAFRWWKSVKIFVSTLPLCVVASFSPPTLKRSKTQVCYGRHYSPSACDVNDVIVFSLSILFHSNKMGLWFPICRCLHSGQR